MKILVPVKRVVDYNVKVRAKSDESGPDQVMQKWQLIHFARLQLRKQ